MGSLQRISYVQILWRSNLQMNSEKQYKDRFSAWSLSKNVRTKDMKHLVRIKVKRDAAGKATKFMVHATKVDHSKVDRFIKRKSKKLGDGRFIELINEKGELQLMGSLLNRLLTNFLSLNTTLHHL